MLRADRPVDCPARERGWSNWAAATKYAGPWDQSWAAEPGRSPRVAAKGKQADNRRVVVNNLVGLPVVSMAVQSSAWPCFRSFLAAQYSKLRKRSMAGQDVAKKQQRMLKERLMDERFLTGVRDAPIFRLRTSAFPQPVVWPAPPIAPCRQHLVRRSSSRPRAGFSGRRSHRECCPAGRIA